jgi:spoIIIJ-associated protein
MNAAVRINLDAGDYRHRQNDKLRGLALHLAERVKSTGKAYSTRPLSSYHRRIIHLTLQDDEQVQTHSMGEGALKRVVVQRRR